MSNMIYSLITYAVSASLSKKDSIIARVIVLNNQPEKVNDQLKPYLCCKNEFTITVEGSCLIWANSVVVPFQMRKEYLPNCMKTIFN